MSAREAPCPGCGKPTAAETAPTNRWLPFCSERCKMTDLGMWFAERYTIADDDDAAVPPPDTRPQ